MKISFHEWEDSAGSRRTAGSLGDDEIQVWLATTPTDPADLTTLRSLLSPEERQRAERFKVSGPRREFVFGRTLMRQLLGACLNVEPATVIFGYQPRGKPFLAQTGVDSDLRFNLAHSGAMVVVALARGREVGVDIESHANLNDWPELAGRIFSPRELGELHSLPPRQQREAFFNGWTRKEAYLKATGEGLTDDLPAIEVTLSPGKAPELIRLPADPEATRRWAFRDIPLPPDVSGAVVFDKSLPTAHESARTTGASPEVNEKVWPATDSTAH